MELLEHLDRTLIVFINGLHSPFFDTFFYYVSKTYVGAPIYLFAIFLFYKIFQYKKAILYTILLIACVGAADLISVHAFKEVFLRYRPSHNLDIQDALHYVNGYRGGMFGFVSSHAANVFAFAVFSSLIFKRKAITITVLSWAMLVSYSRIYLGVHYPADILGGAIIGSAISYVIYRIQDKLLNNWG